MDVKVTSQGGQNSYDINDSNGASNQGNETSIQSMNKSDAKNTEFKPVSVDDAKKAVDKVNKLLEDKTTHVEYQEDANFKSVMVMKVVDNTTNEVLREIPSKQIMDLIAQFAEMAGLVLDKKV
ncbi:flagellar protein FlaG [Clostridium akagii]|uniref:flagellar protein FlaG n=1 Tax=Clostridium akagii TaxID=91623 RepID=UPI00047CB4D9|nr:flagellar protein FlaG [Clostridium akagii]